MSTSVPGRESGGRIVVGVDGSPESERALQWAAERARVSGQELHAVIAWEIPVAYHEWVTAEIDWSGDAALALEKSVDNVLGGHDAARVVRHVLRGHPAKVLAEQAGPDDLLVVGSRGHGGFAALLLGSVGRYVVAHAACPVVVVHDERTATGRIVVGVDGSAESQAALRWASGQARSTGRSLRAVLAWQRPLGYGLVDRPLPDWTAHAAHTLATAVRDALGAEDAATVEQEVVEGEPAEVLLDSARDADLLVVGSRGRGGFVELVLGSVSGHAAAHAPCPVAVHHAASPPGP